MDNYSLPPLRTSQIYLDRKYTFNTSHISTEGIVAMPEQRTLRIAQKIPEGMENTGTSPDEIKKAISRARNMHNLGAVENRGKVVSRFGFDVESTKRSNKINDEMNRIREHANQTSLDIIGAIFEVYSHFLSTFQNGWKVRDSILQGRRRIGKKICLIDERDLADRLENNFDLDSIFTRNTRSVMLGDREVEAMPILDEIEIRSIIIQMASKFDQSVFAAELWFSGMKFGLPAIGIFDDNNPVGFRLISNMNEVIPERIELVSMKGVELGLTLIARAIAIKRLAFGQLTEKLRYRNTQVGLLKRAFREINDQWPNSTIAERTAMLLKRRNIFGHLFSNNEIDPERVSKVLEAEIEGRSALDEIGIKRGERRFQEFIESINEE